MKIDGHRRGSTKGEDTSGSRVRCQLEQRTSRGDPAPLNDQVRLPRGVGTLCRLAEQILNVLPTCRKAGRQ